MKIEKQESAPSSVHGSRVDLTTFDKGSAIYLGCSPPRTNLSSNCPLNSSGTPTKTVESGSNQSLACRKKSPKNTPPVSPKYTPNKSKSRIKPSEQQANKTVSK